MENYKEIAKQARIKILDLIYRAQTSHIGSNFSCVDILAVLFEKADLSKDKIILSKGWAAAAFYYFLWRKGKITEEELNSFCGKCSKCSYGVEKIDKTKGHDFYGTCSDCFGSGQSKFIGLTEPSVPGVDFAGGSMGVGLPAGVGFALSKKLKGEEGKVYVIMSDGELQCGTTWESKLIAGQFELDNLVVIVDNNGLQAMGKTREILRSTMMPASIDWHYDLCDGHDYSQIEECLERPGPVYIDARTIKGKGVSFFEGNNIWHYRAPNKDEYELALKELNAV